MSLREIGKTRRRGRVLRAARQCIDAGGAENLSLKAIAKLAEVSVATLYNLFGSKEGILVALVVVSIESFRTRQSESDSSHCSTPESSPRFDSLSAIAIDEFVSDEFFYRELLKSLQQIESRVHLNGVVDLCLDLGEPVVERMVAAGEIEEVVSPRVLSHQLFNSFVHALQLWSSGLSSSDQFRMQVAHAHALTLAGLATDPFRAKLHSRLRELDAAMLETSRQQSVASEPVASEPGATRRSQPRPNVPIAQGADR